MSRHDRGNERMPAGSGRPRPSRGAWVGFAGVAVVLAAVEGLAVGPRLDHVARLRAGVDEVAADVRTLQGQASGRRNDVSSEDQIPPFTMPPPAVAAGAPARAADLAAALPPAVRQLVAGSGVAIQMLAVGPAEPATAGLVPRRCRVEATGTYPQVRKLVLSLSNPPWLLGLDTLEVAGRRASGSLAVRLGMTVYTAP